MPFVITPPRRRARAALALAGAAVALALGSAPAQAQSAYAGVCTTPSFSKVFLPWNDTRDYTLSPGGDMEGRMPGWMLVGGAAVVPGNESFHVGGWDDRASLRIPAGASVITAPMCIDKTYPSFRFFARKAGIAASDLKVEVLWWESGAVRVKNAQLDRAVGTAWAPVKSLRLPAGALSTPDLEPVVFRFSVTGTGAAWQVDDLYVDPWARR